MLISDINYLDVAGDVKYVDRNGDGVVDDNDRDIIGNPNPDFTYGFQTNLNLKFHSY